MGGSNEMYILDTSDVIAYFSLFSFHIVSNRNMGLT